MGKDLGRGWTVEKEWTTSAGLEARIHKFTPTNPYPDYYTREYYCGYVKTTKSMSFFHQQPFEEPFPHFEVHGGVTFFGVFDKRDTDDGIKWIGFDCNHYWDELDPKCIWYVERECESLAIQISDHEGLAEGRE